MTPADFLMKYGPLVGAKRGEMASDLGSVVHERYTKLRDGISGAIELLEHSDPHPGGRTDLFIKKLKKLLSSK